jgi:hypothetical protein
MLTQNNHYKTVVVMSPMHDGDETKDQDRAVWYPECQTACVCDGVTSSPYAEEGADWVSKLSPVIFSDNIEARLRMICDFLNYQRAEKLNSKIHLPNKTAPTMQTILEEAARNSIACSYQTTLVTAKFVLQDNSALVTVVTCGDSMFLAFDSSGQQLVCLYGNNKPQSRPTSNNKYVWPYKYPSNEMPFGPGDEILAKVIGSLTKQPQTAAKLGIRAEHHDRWLICQILDKCGAQKLKDALYEERAQTLRHSETIVVPKYLAGRTITIGANEYINFPYSRMIKTSKLQSQYSDFSRHGSVNAVLPDHFYTGQWSYFQDRFPLDAEFVLCTDSFYGCFKSPSELWIWLNDHRQEIQISSKNEPLLKNLHQRLRENGSDDDISFVWV